MVQNFECLVLREEYPMMEKIYPECTVIYWQESNVLYRAISINVFFCWLIDFAGQGPSVSNLKKYNLDRKSWPGPMRGNGKGNNSVKF
jgi:hypothetical protein